MPSLRPILALIMISAIAAACSTPSSPSDDSGGATPSATASVDAGGGGGGGGGTGTGSAKYEISGDISKSGELAFSYVNGGISHFVDTGWGAYFYSEDQQILIQINSMAGSNIVNFSDGEILIPGTADTGCTFDFSQNDASGLKGTIDCQNVTAINGTTGAQQHVNMRVTVDAHT
jgi:hypothetical protein